MPEFRRVLRFINENQILGWLGLTLGLAGIVSTQAFALPDWLSSLLLAAGWLLATFFLVVLLFRRTTGYAPVRCLECYKEYELQGPRGKQFKQTETMDLEFLKAVNLVNLSRRSSSAKLSAEEVRMGEIRPDNGGEAVLHKPRTYTVHDGNHVHLIKLELPRAMQRGEAIKVVSKTAATDCFPDDDEGVGKSVLFPIRRISFRLTFIACKPRDITADVKTPGGDGKAFTPLTAVVSGDAFVVEYTALDLQPGDECRVSWSWDDPETIESGAA